VKSGFFWFFGTPAFLGGPGDLSPEEQSDTENPARPDAVVCTACVSPPFTALSLSTEGYPRPTQYGFNAFHDQVMDFHPLIKGHLAQHLINRCRSTAQLVVALKPLHEKARIKRVVVAIYQSVSGAGKEAMDELFAQSKAVFMLDEVEAKKFSKRIAFNVIPHIDIFMEDGYTKEEWKMVVETKKILDPKIKLTATCVRVPVFVGHSEAVNIEFEQPLPADEARKILRNAPGCLVLDKREDGGYVTHYECVGEDATYISRIREDATIENGLQIWIVSDNLRKGAALNAVQIAECLVNRKLIQAKRRAA
jgi:aspartate-semialdehyde dehydrogenase